MSEISSSMGPCIAAVFALASFSACSDPTVGVVPALVARADCIKVAEKNIGQATEGAAGFAPSDVLELALGKHEAPVRWLPVHGATYNAANFGARVVVEVALPPNPTFKEASYALEDKRTEACGSVLEMPVDVTLRSSDGALEEAFRALLSASRDDTAILSYALAPSELLGSLAFRDLPTSPYVTPKIDFKAAITPLGLSGVLVPRYASRGAGQPAPDGTPAHGNLALIGR